MAKIADAVARALTERQALGSAGGITGRSVAAGEGWAVADVVCTAGPHDRPFEEQQSAFTIAMVVAGTFQYRSSAGRELMTPGSLMLSHPGQCFECGHEHGHGDRCVSFTYDPEYLDRLAADAGIRASRPAFPALRVPPVRAVSRLVADACAGVTGATELAWEELGVELAVRTLRLVDGRRRPVHRDSPDSVRRVTRAVRAIERHPEAQHTLGRLARDSGLSVYHFLRIFERLTGVTPHQFVRRARLREAALGLAAGSGQILDIAFDSGFGDVSNFNHAFRAEFASSPRQYRQRLR